jgi:predicted  nucleic acid-binding Zn-ribbon protein
LTDLKLQEARVLEDEVLQRDDVLSAVQSFERKSAGLQGHIRDIESEDTTRRVNELKGEEKTLDHEIHELETRLYEMKARQRHLLREIDGLNNSVQSKLSSYKSALVLADKDIKNFLARPPLQSTNHTAAAAGIWSLPRERRTLEMAKEHYTDEQHALRTRLSTVEEEKNALEDGAAVWEEVVQEVSSVEKALREEMQLIRPPLLDSDSAKPAAEGMRNILQIMQRARSRIESRLDLAEAKNWKLLVCCIGAELEALVEGQGVLEGAFEASEPGRGKGKGKMNGHGAGMSLLGEEGPDLEHADELLSMERERSEDEDDGPGPELLISHHDDE